MRTLARLAVILAGSAASAAFGLALSSSPAHADDGRIVRDLLGVVTDTVDTVFAPQNAPAERKPKPDRPTPSATRPDATQPVTDLVDTATDLVTDLPAEGADEPDPQPTETPDADPAEPAPTATTPAPPEARPAPAVARLLLALAAPDPGAAAATGRAQPTSLLTVLVGHSHTHTEAASGRPQPLVAEPDAAPPLATVPASSSETGCPQLPLVGVPAGRVDAAPPAATGAPVPAETAASTGRAPAPATPPA